MYQDLLWSPCILQISHQPVVTQLVGVRTEAHMSPNQPRVWPRLCSGFPLFPLFTPRGLFRGAPLLSFSLERRHTTERAVLRPSTNSTCPRATVLPPCPAAPPPCVSGLARRLQCESQKREWPSQVTQRERAMLRAWLPDIPEILPR